MKPSDEDIQEFVDMYGDLCPNPKHYPQSFKYYWALFERNRPRGTEVTTKD